MEINLTSITLSQGDRAIDLRYASAVMHIVTDILERGWFVSIQGLDNPGFAEALFASDDIRMRMLATTAEGIRLEGDCHVHPLMDASGVNLKGEGRLYGYEELLKRGR
jgi:hypothetical protein